MILKPRFFPTPADDFDPQLVSIDFDGSTENLLNSTNQTIGIANTWTVSVWWKPDASTAQMSLVDISRTGLLSSIRLQYLGDIVGDPFEIACRNSAGALIQHKSWNIGDVSGLWTLSTMIRVSNDQLFYHNGVDQGAPDNTAASIVSDMADNTRNVGIGALFNAGIKFDGRIHSVGIWSSALGASEVAALYNSGEGAAVDWANDSGDYVSSANLVHWWRLGHDSSDIGKDYGTGTAIDVDQDAVNITAGDDIVSDYPGI